MFFFWIMMIVCIFCFAVLQTNLLSCFCFEFDITSFMWIRLHVYIGIFVVVNVRNQNQQISWETHAKLPIIYQSPFNQALIVIMSAKIGAKTNVRTQTDCGEHRCICIPMCWIINLWGEKYRILVIWMFLSGMGMLLYYFQLLEYWIMGDEISYFILNI